MPGRGHRRPPDLEALWRRAPAGGRPTCRSGALAEDQGAFTIRTLIVATSCNRLPSGHPTGLWAEEYAVPYMALTEAGFDVVVASPAGGTVPVDEKSKPSQSEANEWAPALAALQSTVPLASVQ